MLPKSAAGSAGEWLGRARSSLSLAKVDKPADCLWEDLCFHAQQAAEKAIKAVLVHRNLPFRFVHDINELLSVLQQAGIEVPASFKEAGTLNEFAVMTRYPGPYESVSEDDYQHAVVIAESIVAWAISVVTPPG